MKVREQFKGYQEMVYKMEEEKLLSTDDDYTISYKNDELFINGKKQSAAVTDRYKKYFEKETTIRKSKGKIDVDPELRYN